MRLFAPLLSIFAGLYWLCASDVTDLHPPADAIKLVSFNRGDASDRSWLNQTATTSAGVTFPSGYRMADFDGTSSAVVTYPDADPLDDNPLTVCMWARIDSSSTRVSLIGKCVVTAGATQYRGWYVHFIGTGTPGNYGLVWNTGTDPLNYISIYSGSPATYGDGTWRHLAFVRDQIGVSTNWKIYVNGAEISKTVVSGGTVTTIANSELLKIGGQTTANQTSYFNGALDDVRLYWSSKTAAEIAAIYAEGIEPRP